MTKPEGLCQRGDFAPNRAFLYAAGEQKYTLSAQSVFPDVHAAGKNGLKFLFGLRAEKNKAFTSRLNSSLENGGVFICGEYWI